MEELYKLPVESALVALITKLVGDKNCKYFISEHELYDFQSILEKNNYHVTNNEMDVDAVYLGTMENFKDKNYAKNIYEFINKCKYKRIIIFIEHKLLFSNRIDEKKFRKNILENNYLSEVVDLPTAISPDDLSLILLDKSERSNKFVKFIDLKQARDSIKHITNKDAKYDDCEKIISSIIDDSNFYKEVDSNELLVNNKSLCPSSHCFSERQKRAFAILKKYSTKPLRSLVDFFRPFTPNKDQVGEKICAFKEADLTEYGYLKSKTCSEILVNRGGRTDQLLQANDIIFCIRMYLGSVGIIPPDFDSKSLWTAPSSCIILRPKANLYDPRLIYLFLRSPVGQRTIGVICQRASLPIIQIEDLKNLEIPILCDDEAKAQLEIFDEEVSLCREREILNDRLRDNSRKIWAL